MDGERGEPLSRLEMTGAAERYLTAAAACDGRVAPLLEVLASVPADELAPFPGSGPGSTADRFAFLVEVAVADLTAARVVEPHLDAVAILAEASEPPEECGHTWGVFAAEGPGASLQAERSGSAWRLDGVKPWCSLGDRLTDALVTAHTGSGESRLFRLDLTQPAVTPEPTRWVSRGLAEVQSGPLRFERAVAHTVGDTGWYLSRPGFRWGAIGVAAAWWGGCIPLFDALLSRARRESASPLVTARVGRLYRSLRAARLLLDEAAEAIDGESRSAHSMAALAHTTRGAVADAAVETLDVAHDVLGPAVFGFDESLARRADDLQMYISQYHRGPDDVSLVSHLADGEPLW